MTPTKGKERVMFNYVGKWKKPPKSKTTTTKGKVKYMDMTNPKTSTPTKGKEKHSFKLCKERPDLCEKWGCKCSCHTKQGGKV